MFSNENSYANGAQYIDKIEEIRREAFAYTDGLPSILILKSQVKNIEDSAFVNKGQEITVYYSYKTTLGEEVFGNQSKGIQVNPTKFIETDEKLDYNNTTYNKIEIPDLSTDDNFSSISKIKNYLLVNIDTFFENYPIAPDGVSDLTSSNISFDYSATDDGRTIYLSNIKLNYYYDNEGDIIQSSTSSKMFGNIAFVQKIKPTTFISSIPASELGWEEVELTEEWIQQQQWENVILTNKEKFIQGDDKISSISDIQVNLKEIQQDKTTLLLTWVLKKGTYYDENGDLAIEDKTIQTKIINFIDATKKQTIINDPIDAASLDLSTLTAEEAQNQITKKMIVDRASIFFQGDYQIDSTSNILNLVVRVSGNNLSVSFTLAAGAWYDEDGQLGRVTKDFSTTITNFKAKPEEGEHVATKLNNPIYASTLGWADKQASEVVDLINANFIFQRLAQFFQGDHKIADASDLLSVTAKVNGNKIDLSVTLRGGTWYDLAGALGVSAQEFTSEIINFKDPQQQAETKIKPQITAAELSWSEQTAEAAAKLINESWILTNKNILFLQGIEALTQVGQISNINATASANSISLSFALAADAWYNAQGQLGGKVQTFTTTIINFKDKPTEETHTPTNVNQRIEASVFGWAEILNSQAQSNITASWIFNQRSKILTGDYKLVAASEITAVSAELVGQRDLTISFTLANNTWYDQDGQLKEQTKTFSFQIVNFKDPQQQAATEIKDSIDASIFGWANEKPENVIDQINSLFILQNFTKFFIGNHNVKNESEISVSSSINNQQINLEISLAKNTWYNNEGNLGQDSQTFKTRIVKFAPNISDNEDSNGSSGSSPWKKWWNVSLLCIASAVVPIGIILLIRKWYKVRSRRK